MIGALCGLLLLGGVGGAQSWLEPSPSQPPSETVPELSPAPALRTEPLPSWPRETTLPEPRRRAFVPLRVGVVLSLSGDAQQQGSAQRDALEALARRWQQESRLGGVGLELTILDDRSSPEHAVVQAQTLFAQTGDDAVHALICCTTSAASEQVLPLAERAQVPTLALARAPQLSAGRAFWSFGVVPDERRLIQAMVLDMAAQGMEALALMAPQGGLGDQAQQALDGLLVPGGLRLATSQRYPPEARVLTPEALLVATSQPGSVLLWGGPGDTRVALGGLRQRGFEGPVYLNPALLQTFPLRSRALAPRTTPTDGLSIAAPLSVADQLRADHPNYAAVQRYRNSVAAPSLAGAYAWDALTLLNDAYELGLSYGISVDNPVTMRQLIRDTLISGAPLAGVTATFDFEQGDHTGVRGLVVVGLEPSGYRVLR
ncbi:MAG: ABC transporter substrate-binding protein [Trueperaceae bacterium]|nr:ABC transporter substrate-binding protein [Trueperaceae bacterium]